LHHHFLISSTFGKILEYLDARTVPVGVVGIDFEDRRLYKLDAPFAGTLNIDPLIFKITDN